MSQKLGYLFSSLMAVYFLISGLSVLLDVPAKLKRIDLQALNSDGEIAFILIYSSLMVGIGVASLAIQMISKSWVYSTVLATTIIASFILFRAIGSIMVGFLSTVQIRFLAFEIVELTAGILLLRNAKSKI